MNARTLSSDARAAVLDYLSREAKPIDSIQQRSCFSVPSQTKNGHFYNVVVCPDNLPAGRCNCLAGEHGVVCSHLLAAFRAHHDGPRREIEQLRRKARGVSRLERGAQPTILSDCFWREV